MTADRANQFEIVPPPSDVSNPAAHRRDRGTGVDNQGSQPGPPIKPATWEWYIPLYFWLGGISAGSWAMATAEDVAGERDRELIRAARYLSAGTLLAGTGLLIADLGRPDRFHHMLRIVQVRSAMSLGSWGVTLYGGFTGAAALLQAADDGLLGAYPMVSRMSRGTTGRALHLAGLPAALFVGGYTGVLLASTSTPSWAARTSTLGPLFLASAMSSGAAAVSLALELSGGAWPRAARRRSARRRAARRRAARRLARAEAIALALEMVLALRSRSAARRFRSARQEPEAERGMRALMTGAGMAAPLTLAVIRATGRRPGGHRRSAAASLLALGGSLALRYLVTREGDRSARDHADTWQFTARGWPCRV